VDLPTSDRFSVPPLPEPRTSPPRGRALCFAAHPDDECAGPGGALALHRRQGDSVRVVVVTDGRAGDPQARYERASYTARRQQESRDAMALLGVDDFVFWGYPDDCVITDNDIETIALRASAELAAFAPEVIYAPWEGEGNSDHRAVYCGVVRALGRLGYAGTVLGYETWNAMVPDVISDITPVASAKREALLRYTTQLAYNDYVHCITGLNAYRAMVFNRGRGYGEAFRRIEPSRP
jgi:LmbE family N-acetylglucosaminyl deacetylase